MPPDPAGTAPADGAFAIGNDEQYRPVQAVGDQRIRVAGRDGAGLLMCHASRPLERPRREGGPLVVVVHGALRDSGRYLAGARHAARLSGADVLIVAPQFLADVDARGADGDPEDALYWDVEGWKGGYPALGGAVSSFAAMDSLLEQLAPPAAPDRWPAVVIFGNSAGGQFVNRYAAVGYGPDALDKRGIPVRFIIANPSTYLYFDRQRPHAVQGDARVNRWRYGFDDVPPYVDISSRQGLERYLGRDVTIVLGARDTDRAALLLEVSPPAMAQGADRVERGVLYDEHIRRCAREAGLSTSHQLIQLAGIGHTAADVLAASQTRALMFG